MTPDQKRAHLTLHGCTLHKFRTMDLGDEGWRIMQRHKSVTDNLTPNVYVRGWRVGTSTTPDRYTEHPWSDLPDDLLDSLEPDLIERFLSINP